MTCRWLINPITNPNPGMIKSRRMRRAGHLARMEATRNACRILVGKPEGKTSLGRDQDVGGWTILKWILER
jgi:hypothetical protein